MRITFVYPDLSLGSAGKFYHGVAYLSAVLKKAGHTVRLIHLTRPIDQRKYKELLVNTTPDLVGFSATTHMFPLVRELAKWTKQSLDVPIICGGAHPTICPEEVIRSAGIDMVCIGEGEEAMVELSNKLEKNEDITGIRNIWLNSGGKIYRNPLRPLINDLDTLPFPDREIFDYQNLTDIKIMKRGAFLASRGCPYNCSYCCNHIYKELYQGKGKYIRLLSVDRVLDEIHETIRKYPMTQRIDFQDDMFVLNRQWFAEFMAKYRQKIGLPLTFNARPETINREIIEMVKEVGDCTIEMGIESGDERIRQEVLGRTMNNNQIKNAFALCHEAGIKTLSYNMVGLPFESMKSILATVKLNALIRPSEGSQVSIFYPYPKTRLFNLCKQQNLLTNKKLDSCFEDTALNFNALLTKQIIFSFKWFHRLIRLYSFTYRLPNFISKMVIKILDKILESRGFISLQPVLNLMYSWLRLVKKLVIKGNHLAV